MPNWTPQDAIHYAMRTAKQHNAPHVGEVTLPAQSTSTSPASAESRLDSQVAGGVVSARIQSFDVKIEPVAAPRMTRRDKWLQPRRDCVQRYFDYRDALQIHVGDIPIVPDEIHLHFHISMPESWSHKKCLAMDGKPHRQRPDKDNLCKAILDALFIKDGGIWRGSQEKFWTISGDGKVQIRMVWHHN